MLLSGRTVLCATAKAIGIGVTAAAVLMGGAAVAGAQPEPAPPPAPPGPPQAQPESAPPLVPPWLPQIQSEPAPPPAPPGPPQPGCTAADLAQVSGGVATATSAYLFSHPDVNNFFTSLRGLPNDQVPNNVRDYMNANPQAKTDLTGIRQPLMDLRNRCQ